MGGVYKRLLEYLKRSREHVRPLLARTADLSRSRRTRKVGLIVVIVILFLGVATYFAVPPILPTLTWR